MNARLDKPVGIEVSVFFVEGSATGPVSVRPNWTRGQTGNLRSRRLAWGPALISLYSLANRVSDKSLLVPEFAGHKLGGIWFSPTSRPGTGESLYPCVDISFTSFATTYSKPHWSCEQSEWKCFELVCLTLYMKSRIFSGLLLYWNVEVGVFEIY